MPANVPLTFNQKNLYRATTAVPETLRVFAGFIQRTTFYDKLREHIPFGIQIEEKLSMILCTTRIKLRIKKTNTWVPQIPVKGLIFSKHPTLLHTHAKFSYLIKYACHGLAKQKNDGEHFIL